jgi:hypothetical protein
VGAVVSHGIVHSDTLGVCVHACVRVDACVFAAILACGLRVHMLRECVCATSALLDRVGWHMRCLCKNKESHSNKLAQAEDGKSEAAN